LEISVEAVKALRDRTAAGIMECKRALEQSNGDLNGAEEILRERSLASATKKASRSTDQGLVESYIHSGGLMGAMVEVNCETDFVARTTEFKELAHDLAMQVAAMSPVYVDTDDIPQGEEASAQEACLMQQPFIKDPSKSVQDLVTETVAKVGENVRVKRFIRFSLGE